MTDEDLDTTPRPVPWRLGRLTLVFGAIVLVGLAINAAMNSERDDAGSGIEFDVENFPLGALGGEEAPPLTFPLLGGGTFDLDHHLATDGRPVVLNFWASWCFPCRAEMPEFSEIAEANPDVAFVGVAVDDGRESAAAFADEVRVVYPLGVDDDNTVAANYPYIGLPTTYLIGSDGVVTHQIQGQVSGEALQAFIDYDFP